MKDKLIGVFDSGIGGLTILEELKKNLPHEGFIYYADSINNPYGNKKIEELMEITRKIVDFLIIKDVKIIVIACNTATVMCMKKLRLEYPNIIFVGVVPAIKLACDNNFKNILVMATPITISSNRINELVSANKKKEENIVLLPCNNLAHAIEENNNKEIDELLNDILNDYVNTDIDAIVLGCTHYPLIKDKIQNKFPKAVLLDSSYGVAKEVKRQLEINNLSNFEQNEQKITIINSKIDI